MSVNDLIRPPLAGGQATVAENPYAEAAGFLGLTAPSSGAVIQTQAQAQVASNPTELIGRAVDRQFDTSSELSPDDANARFGIEWDGKKVLSWSEPVNEATAAELRDLKIAELRRQFTLSRAQGGFWEGVGGFAASVAAGLTDPINVGLSFVPIVGAARYAELLAGASGAIGRAAVRAGVGAIEGAAGAALIEPIVYGLSKLEQADYTLADSFQNVVFGGVLGAGLHAGFGALGDAIGMTHISAPAREDIRPPATAHEPGGAPVIEAPQSPAETAPAAPASPEVFSPETWRPRETETALSTRALADRVLGNEPAAAFTSDARLLHDAVATSAPEIADRLARAIDRMDAASARVAQERAGVDALDQAAALETVDAASADRLRAVDAELSGTISPARRQALIEERAAITESLGPGGLDKAQSDLRIGPNRRLRDALKAERTARQELAAATRQAEREVGLSQGPGAVANELAAVARDYARMPMETKAAMLRGAVSELVTDGRVRLTGPISDALTMRRPLEAEPAARTSPTPPMAEPKGDTLDQASAALEATSARLDAARQIAPISADQARSMADADEMISRARAEAKALDVAAACAMRRV